MVKTCISFAAAKDVREPLVAMVKLVRAGAKFEMQNDGMWMNLGPSSFPVVVRGGRTFLKVRVRGEYQGRVVAPVADQAASSHG